MASTQYLDLPDGRLAYDDQGEGTLLIATSAMLDLRSELRFIAPLLVRSGFRVVTIDQRGMGESSAVWPAYGSDPMADDIIALVRHLQAGPAIIYGTSNGSAAGVLVAARAPELVRGLVLVAPFVRDGKASWVQRQMMKVMRIPFLTTALYLSYFPKWEPQKPADFAEHMAKLKANLREPSRRRVARCYMFQQSHAKAEAHLKDVHAPAIVLMGTADIDWPDPAAEARWICEQLGCQAVMLEGAGHHPHVGSQEQIASAVRAFADQLVATA